jgi:2-polyprenyl-3-methyl-5-hydroxy-6-metoxy-1,4-benzoquinol methylase
MPNQKLERSLAFGNELVPIINLGMHPFADWFIPEELLSESEPILPLVLCLDELSGLIHTQLLSDPSNRYNGVDYSYTSSNSLVAQKHWDKYAEFVSESSPIGAKKVFEIGSNDGYLCAQLNQRGFHSIGIDASSTMVDFANELGVKSINALLTESTADEIRSEFGPADVVIANNVLNHANDPLSFLIAMTRLKTEKGLLYIEVPYWKFQFENFNFDMIYHEHVSYFTLTSLANILGKIDLTIVDFSLVDYHGQSIRLVAGTKDQYPEAKYLRSQMESEKKVGLFQPASYKLYNETIKKNRGIFLHELSREMFRFDSVNIVGIGAAAKGNTFLNFYGLNSTNVFAITDSSPRKIGKYTPLSRIEICPDELIRDLKNPLLFMLSWNLGEGLRNKIKSINPKVRFLK